VAFFGVQINEISGYINYGQFLYWQRNSYCYIIYVIYSQGLFMVCWSSFWKIQTGRCIL